MPLRVVKRQAPPAWSAWLILLCALALSLGASLALLAALGKSPIEGLLVLWNGSFGALWALQDALVKAVPIFLCSLGLAVAFRMQVWNIGAEGQYALGAIGAGWAALAFPAAPVWLLLPLMLVCAALTGAAWAAIPGLLKVRLRANEIITTLMLNYVAIGVLDYLVYGPWKDPVSYGFPVTPEFSESATIPMLGFGQIHGGLFICIAAGFLLWAFLRFTRLGYELKACGEGAKVAAYARMPYNWLVLFVLTASGAFAGVAGFVEASATTGRLMPSIMAGYGYTAIIVAWIARLRPLTIALASFLLAALRVGVENIQLDMEVPAAFGGIMEGLILLTVLAGQFFEQHKLVRKGPKNAPPLPAPESAP